MFNRPSLLRPPLPPNTTMPGAVCTSVDEPAWVTVFGINCIRLLYERVTGIDVITSLSIVVVRRTLWTSTMGDSAVTVKVSWSPPIFSSASIVATKEPDNATASRRTVLNPGNANVTVYVPERRSTMR